MKNTYKNFAVFSLIALFAVMPAFSFAKEKKEKDEGFRLGLGLNALVEARVDDEDRRERSDRREDRDDDRTERPTKSCLKAFGHLVSKGFIKNNGEVSADFWKDCFIPKGIAKKLGGRATSTATSTVDVTAPKISNISVVSGTTTALIGWKTDEKATSRLYYGTSSPLNLSASSTLSLSGRILRKINTVVINGLSAGTTYYFRIQAEDKAGNATTSAQSSFITR